MKRDKFEDAAGVVFVVIAAVSLLLSIALTGVLIWGIVTVVGHFTG